MKKHLWLSLFLLFSLSCTNRTRPNSYGLDLIEIRMSGAQFGEANRSPMIKIFYPSKTGYGGKNYNTAIQPAGKSTAREPKKNWDLRFQDDSPFSAKEIRLGAMVVDPSMLRSVLSIAVFRAAGFQPTTITPVFVTLNDLVLGLYYRLEKTNDDFFNARNIDWQRLYEARNNADFAKDMNMRLDTAYEGKPEPANLELIALLTRITHMQSDAEFESSLFRILDRDSVVAYLSASLITNHYDGFQKNLFFYESKGNQVRINPWDFDLDWVGDISDDSGLPDNTETAPWAKNQLFNRVANLPSVKAAISAQTASLLAGPASYPQLSQLANEYQNRIRAAYEADPLLGQMGRSLDTEVAKLLQAAQAHLQVVQNSL